MKLITPASPKQPNSGNPNLKKKKYSEIWVVIRFVNLSFSFETGPPYHFDIGFDSQKSHQHQHPAFWLILLFIILKIKIKIETIAILAIFTLSLYSLLSVFRFFFYWTTSACLMLSMNWVLHAQKTNKKYKKKRKKNTKFIVFLKKGDLNKSKTQWAPIRTNVRQMADIDANEIRIYHTSFSTDISHFFNCFLLFFAWKYLIFRTCWLFIAPSVASYACLRYKSIRRSRCIRSYDEIMCICLRVGANLRISTHIYTHKSGEMASFDTNNEATKQCVGNGHTYNEKRYTVYTVHSTKHDDKQFQLMFVFIYFDSPSNVFGI